MKARRCRGITPRGLRAAVCLIATLVLAACGGLELSVRHRETGLNSAFGSSGLPYEVYVANARSIIARTRVDLRPERRDTVVDWNSPFILEPDTAACSRAASGRYRNGIVLIHGLTDSPFQMRDLGGYFQRKCFLVFGLLLPGHGTVPGDLLAASYEEWVKATEYAVAALKTRVDRFFVGGASTGGTLALHTALTGERPAALVLLAPVISLRAGRVSGAKLLRIVFDFHESGRWAMIAADEDPAKYESFPTNAAYQIWRLTRRLTALRRSRPLDTPVFAALVEDDMSVDSSASLEYLRSATLRQSRILVYGRGGRDDDARFVRLPAARPEDMVLDFSHIGLSYAPGNPHYGRHGDYSNCLHYLDEPQIWNRCKRDRAPAGEITPDNLARGVIRRLTYNPDFSNMLTHLDAFLAGLE